MSLSLVQRALGRPRWRYPMTYSPSIGGGGSGHTNKWSQTASGSPTWITAAHNIIIFNFNSPSDGYLRNHSVSLDGVANLRSLNPDAKLGSYTRFGTSHNNVPPAPGPNFDDDNCVPTLQGDWFITGTNGAADGDGLMREPDGTILQPSTAAQFSSYQNNLGTFSGFGDDSTVDPPEIPDYSTADVYPQAWMAMNRWHEWWSIDADLDLDIMYIDVFRWPLRDDEEGTADLDRDNTVEAYDYDASVPGSLAESIGLSMTLCLDKIQELHQAAWGKPLSIGGNNGANWDYYDGARSDTGPAILTAAKQPAGLQSRLDWTYAQHWGRAHGYNDDGSDRASGNYIRAVKQACRMRAYSKTSSLTGTPLVCADPQHDDVTNVLNVQQTLTLRRYYVCWQLVLGLASNVGISNQQQRDTLLDEYVAGDVFNMTIAQIMAQTGANGWLGAPRGKFPAYITVTVPGTPPDFISGVQGGVIQDGVWGMEFEKGLVMVNPKGNGDQTITVPSGSWKTFAGVQSPAVNDDTNVGSTFFFNEVDLSGLGGISDTCKLAEGIVLQRQ